MYVGDNGRIEILHRKSDDTFLVKFSDLPFDMFPEFQENVARFEDNQFAILSKEQMRLICGAISLCKTMDVSEANNVISECRLNAMRERDDEDRKLAKEFALERDKAEWQRLNAIFGKNEEAKSEPKTEETVVTKSGEFPYGEIKVNPYDEPPKINPYGDNFSILPSQ